MMESINNGSRIIAEYLGWDYVPFNQLNGLKKAGWYKRKSAAPKIQKLETTIYSNGGIEKAEFEINTTPLEYNKKNGWFFHGDSYYKYVARHHADLCFYNSMDELLRVIEKLEKEDLSDYFYKWKDSEGKTRNNFEKISFVLYNHRCYSEIELLLDPAIEIARGDDEHLTWTQNTFNCVVDTINYINEVRKNEK